MNYKSQYGQDKWIVENLYDGMTHGFFVDIGAGDGEMISNTWVLEKELQWDGICIDPSDVTWEALNRNRSCTKDNVIVSNTDGEMDFYDVTSVGYFDSYFSSTSIPPVKYSQYEVKKKKSERLFTALTRLNSSTLIHYLSLDTEGMELSILRKFFEDEYVTNQENWKRRVLAIGVEHNLQPAYMEELRDLLEKNFYTRAVTLGVDDIYVHRIYDVMYK